MIIKGGARGGAGNLAAHLMKERNERVTVLAIDGLAATSIKDALHEIVALSVGTECRHAMYHAAISPHPGEPDLTDDQKARSVELLAEKLKLSGQPYIAVEHQKIGDSGIERTHHHVIWSRVNSAGKTISDFKNYEAHELTSRHLEREFGHKVVPGPLTRDAGTPRPERTPEHFEWQQAERSGLSPKEAKALLSELWEASDSGKAFVAAAGAVGFTVCQGDRRDFVVVDRVGEVSSLARRVPDNAASIRDRMSDLERTSLPTVAQVRATLTSKVATSTAEPEPLKQKSSVHTADATPESSQQGCDESTRSASTATTQSADIAAAPRPHRRIEQGVLDLARAAKRIASLVVAAIKTALNSRSTSHTEPELASDISGAEGDLSPKQDEAPVTKVEPQAQPAAAPPYVPDPIQLVPDRLRLIEREADDLAALISRPVYPQTERSGPTR